MSDVIVKGASPAKKPANAPSSAAFARARRFAQPKMVAQAVGPQPLAQVVLFGPSPGESCE